MTGPVPGGPLDSLEKRLEFLGRTAPFGLLVISVSLALLSGGGWGSAGITLGLAAAAAVWVGWWVSLHPAWAQRQALMRFYYVGFFAFAAVLIVRSPWFAFFAFTGVLHGLQLFRGFWRYAGIAASSVLIAISQTGGVHRPTPSGVLTVLVVALFDCALYLGIGLIGQKSEDLNQRRKQVIGELGEANRRLEEALEEKAGLQAQLLKQAREAGISAERQRLAREIHDTLAQGLTGIITQLQAAQQAAGTQRESQRHIDTAARLARDSLAEARRSVSALRPQLLEDARLPDALAEAAGRWSAIHDVRTEMTTTGEPRPLHPEIEATLLRTAQEALANVGKHADASRVAVTLSYMGDVVTLDVRDDGRGFALAGATPAGHDGFGLTGMRQRLGNVAGTLAIESEPDGGTAISASVPAIGLQGADD